MTTLEEMMDPGGMQCDGVDGSCRDRLLLVQEVKNLRTRLEAEAKSHMLALRMTEASTKALRKCREELAQVEVTDVTGDSAMMAENGRLKDELARVKEAVEEDIATWVLALTIIEEAERMSGHVPFAAVHNPIGRLHAALARTKRMA